MVGIIRQPSFILHDMVFLNTFRKGNGKMVLQRSSNMPVLKMQQCLKNWRAMSLKKYQQKKISICKLVQRNASIKTKVVQQDEFEKDERRLLNFGHTLGHALENQYELMHGQAVAIGMTYACHISEQLTGFKQTERVVSVLEQYGSAYLCII